MEKKVQTIVLATYYNYLEKEIVSHSQKHVFGEIYKYICQCKINMYNNKFGQLINLMALDKFIYHIVTKVK